MALVNAGCTVDAVCPARHPLRKIDAVRHAYTYGGLTPLMSFTDAITSAKPDFIVPGDDPATQHLHDLYDRERRRGKLGSPMCSLIERSLGAAESFPVVYSRSNFLQMAHEEGIRVPQIQPFRTSMTLGQWTARVGFRLSSEQRYHGWRGRKSCQRISGSGTRLAPPCRPRRRPCREAGAGGQDKIGVASHLRRRPVQ